MKTIDTRTVIAGFGDALAEVIAAVLEKQTSAQLTDQAPEAGYVVVLEGRRASSGTLHVHFGRAEAESLAKRMSGSEEEPPQAVILNSLKEICGQATTTLVEKLAAGAQIDVVSAQPWSASPIWTSATAIEFTVDGEDLAVRAAIAGTLEFIVEIDESDDATRPGASPNIDVILDIDLPLVVRFGRTEMSLKDLTALGPGSLINLGRSPEEPVDVLVSNQIVARGEVVTVAGSYGVRIRDVISPADRVRSVEVGL